MSVLRAFAGLAGSALGIPSALMSAGGKVFDAIGGSGEPAKKKGIPTAAGAFTPEGPSPDSSPGLAAPKEPKVESEPIAEPLSAMGRRMGNDPAHILHQGMELAGSEALPLDDESRMAIFEPLARAKAFGKSGGRY